MSSSSPGPDPTTPLKLEDMPLTRLAGVGPALAEKLARIHIHSVLDLLFHLPLRYLDRTRITPIAALRPGLTAVIEGRVAGSAILFGKRRSLLVKVQDHTGLISLRFYHFSAAQKNALASGVRLRCYGEVRWGKSGFELYHPEYKLLDDSNTEALDEYLTPVYPSTEGLLQTRLRSIMTQALKLLQQNRSLPDWLPASLIGELRLLPLQEALLYLHQPPRSASLAELESGRHPAQVRLAFEELLAHYLSLRRLRDQARQQQAPALPEQGLLLQSFLQKLPFRLTAAQSRVAAEVAADMAQPVPMLRLVQGDVGSGKTIIAIMAALQAVANGFQAAVMAPTEILAEQHFIGFSRFLDELNIGLCFLSGRIKGKKRGQTLAQIEQGEARIIIGTHALFQESVNFQRLGLLVIDEQHRFGVHQRLALREKGRADDGLPHQLIMTATPIPRTLTMSAYADLDCSIIDELPPGRTPVNTVLISDQRRDDVIRRIEQACRNGRQAYWVCTLIEESEALQCQAAEATFAALSEQLASLRIGLIHGRMKAVEKSRVMQGFKTGELDLLVATTVIEVGVDVPRASLMIIENPERLGLAQLHQLRGRVGRGSEDSHCLLLYHQPLSEQGRQRLEIMRSSNDGFYIAQKDLELRGPGEVLGTRQTGLIDYRIADLSRDAWLQEDVRRWGELIRQQHPAAVEPLLQRWLAGREQYGGV